jgi:hypothetical protein
MSPAIMESDQPTFFKSNEELWVLLPKTKYRSRGRVYRLNQKRGNELFTELNFFLIHF